MSIGAGQRLGKYELIERVGQGGMAVVYRSRDTSLNREVAIKVLHHHLADHDEARARFGREAHAVAKLHHENILEIHDFSGLDSDESYIVTEFIDGCTLKEFISDHPIHFPEVGAMIVTQVCRALAHAHSVGVLHRDVKPENVMIRRDGVVKLTDFGIAQMVDLQRMTVTGQLLGSPAYMAPEHVEGKDLDFRTDVFAVGIVLYQLVTGELPFNGKNPHEILKRIAECEYPDPRRKNPRVGKELGRIIDKALSKEPDDRYGDVGLMLQALEQYLEASGIGSPKEELARFFEAPAAYQMALEKRLVEHLSERGAELLATSRPAALELFNRVLSIEPEHPEVLAQIRKLGRRERNLRIAMILAGAAGLALLSVVAAKNFSKDKESKAPVAVLDADASVLADTQGLDASTELVENAAQPDASLPDAAPPPPDAEPRVVRNNGNEGNHARRRRPDAGTSGSVEPAAAMRNFELTVIPRGSEYRIGDGPWTAMPESKMSIVVPAGEQRISARNESCCQSRDLTIPAEAAGGSRQIELPYLAGAVTPICKVPGVTVLIDGRPATLGVKRDILMTRVGGTEPVEVKFISDSGVDSQNLTIRAKESREVKCAF